MIGIEAKLQLWTVNQSLCFTPANQALQLPSSSPYPPHQLLGYFYMLFPIHLPPQRRPLQRPRPQVEGERHQRIVLAIGQGHVDQPQDGT